MFKAIANQKIELNKEEFEYYLDLEKSFGKDSFIGLFKTNDKGQIISVTPSPSSPTAMILIFFLLNVMFNQRLRRLDSWIDKMESLEKRIDTLEEKAVSKRRPQ